jgi:hypothetical protein
MRPSSGVLFAVGAALAGCRSGAGTAPVVPGVKLDVTRHAAADTVTYRRSVTDSGRESASGTRVVVTYASTAAGRAPQLVVAQRFPGGGGEIIDTAVADLRTLRAVSHASHQPAKTMHFVFGENSADGTVSARGASDAAPVTQAVHQNVGGAIFDSNIIELVVASLPLRAGFHDSLPFFIFERGGRVPMLVTVRERALVEFSALGRRAAWIVTVGVPGAPATLWIDVRTRAVLRVRYDIVSRQMSFTDERQTPLPG